MAYKRFNDNEKKIFKEGLLIGGFIGACIGALITGLVVILAIA